LVSNPLPLISHKNQRRREWFLCLYQDKASFQVIQVNIELISRIFLALTSLVEQPTKEIVDHCFK
jgi:hypothetical protein